MKLLEGYKKAVELYNNFTRTNDGREKVSLYNQLGIPKEHLVWFTSLIVKDKIPLYIVLNAYRDWKKFVVPFYKKKQEHIPDIISLTYQDMIKIINKAQRSWAKPNPLYDKNGVYVGEFNNFQDANLLPINTTWCITHSKNRFRQFNNNEAKSLYIINNGNPFPYRNVIVVVYENKVEYWDTNNNKLEDNESYEHTLPSEVVNLIYNIPITRNQDNEENNQLNCGRMQNKPNVICLTESDLKRIIIETLTEILIESA